jgi:hypothetical protein
MPQVATDGLAGRGAVWAGWAISRKYHSTVITPEVLGRALGEAPNPELARVAVSRIGERPGARELLERPDIIPAAARLLGFSTAASDFFLSHPEELESLADLSPRAL